MLLEKWNEDDPEEFILNDSSVPENFLTCLRETAKGETSLYILSSDLVTKNFE